MNKEFCLGVALGLVGGALLVANSKKAREMVKKGQTKLTEKWNKLENSQEESSEN